MTIALFYDSETTGLPDFKAPSEAAHQPHIVQLAACLVDLNTRKLINSMDVIICPDGWVIPDDVAKIHGITTERALDEGVPEASAVGVFMDMWAQARTRIAHNEQFDARILRIALMRFEDDAVADHWKAGNAECTAKLATPIVKAPATEKMKAVGRFHHKTANLGEAYRYFMGSDFENAHSAMADVRACMDVYFAIKEGSVTA